MNKFIGIGFELVGLVVVGIVLGSQYNATYQSDLGILVGIVVGFGLWLGHVIYLASKFS